MKSAYLASLKYAPGLKKEFLSFGENLRRRGCLTKYLLSKGYEQLEGNCEGMEFLTASDSILAVLIDTFRVSKARELAAKLFRRFPPEFLCFYNFHPLNFPLGKLAKEDFGAVKVAIYLHEPYKPDKKTYGKVKGTYFHLIEGLQSLCLKHTDDVILPSQLALERFRRRYPAYEGAVHLAPILVPDRNKASKSTRKYFSMVGGVNRATGHNRFLELATHIATKRLAYDLLLVSSSNLSPYLRHAPSRASKVLTVINRRLISDRAIDDAIESSFAVFRLDEEITQSGVIPVAFMNATPVIVRDLPGFTQHVEHRYNGYVVSRDCSVGELLEAMYFVRENFDELSANARQSYEEVFAAWNWEKYYGWLVELVSPS